MEKPRGNRKVQYIAAFCVSIASLTVGVASTWSTPVIVKLRNNETDIQITETEISWMLALNSPGFMSGSLATRFVSDKFGRRTTMLVSTLPFVIGAILAVTTVKAWMLYLTQFLWGSGTGMVGTVMPMYLAEISDKDIRGTLSLSTRIMFSFGSLFMMITGSFLTYYLINCLLLALPVCYFLTCWWIPESPYYHLKDGRIDDARKELTRLKGFRNVKTLEDELTTLQENVQRDMRRSSSAWEFFTGRQYRKAIIIAAGLKLAQIMTGAQTIQHYLGLIMNESKVNLSTATVLIVFGAVRFVVSFMSTILVDRFGRRPLLYYSFVGTALSLFLVGIYFFLQEVMLFDATALKIFNYVPFTGIIISNIVSNLGYISIIFVIPAEIFPMNVKAIALTALSIFGGLISFITTLSYQNIKDLTGLYGVFAVFAGVAVFGAVFVISYVPETKGKSLEEIQVVLLGLDEASNITVREVEKGTELQMLNANEGNKEENT